MLYQLSYEFNNTASNFAAVMGRLEANSHGVLRILSSTWLIDSDLQIQDLAQQIIQVANGDRFFISQVHDDLYSGWHSRETWNWVRQAIARNSQRQQS